jgi:hypothetical protein
MELNEHLLTVLPCKSPEDAATAKKFVWHLTAWLKDETPRQTVKSGSKEYYDLIAIRDAAKTLHEALGNCGDDARQLLTFDPKSIYPTTLHVYGQTAQAIERHKPPTGRTPGEGMAACRLAAQLFPKYYPDRKISKNEKSLFFKVVQVLIGRNPESLIRTMLDDHKQGRRDMPPPFNPRKISNA